MKFRVLLFSFFLSGKLIYSQSTDIMKTILVEEGYALPTPQLKLRKPIIQAGSGVFFYTGEMRERKQIDKYIRPGFAAQLGIEQRFAKHFGIQINAIYGNVISTVHSPTKFQNFKSTLLSGDLRFALNFEFWMSKKTSVAPFLNFGAGFLHFQSKANLRDINGNYYFPWSDGTLRQFPEGGIDPNPSILENDNFYETDVTPNKRNSLQIMGEIGLRFKILNFWDFTTSYTHFKPFTTFTNYSGSNDHYGFVKVGIQYYFGQINFKKKGGTITNPTE